jgi:hypothetical protein
VKYAGFLDNYSINFNGTTWTVRRNRRIPGKGQAGAEQQLRNSAPRLLVTTPLATACDTSVQDDVIEFARDMNAGFPGEKGIYADDVFGFLHRCCRGLTGIGECPAKKRVEGLTSKTQKRNHQAFS